MALHKRKVDLYETEAGQEIVQSLKSMMTDERYNTASSYSTDASYPDHLIPFVAKHMRYLNTHPNVNPDHYLSNLRLMTRLR